MQSLLLQKELEFVTESVAEITTTVTVPRALRAGGEVPVLWRSDDLVNWIEVEDANLLVDPLDDDLDLLSLEVVLDPRPDRQFFQIGR